MALPLSLTHLDAVLQGLSTPWFVRDSEGRFIRTCERLADRLALPEQELPGRSAGEFLPAELVEDSLAADRIVFRKGEPMDREEPRPWDPTDGVALLRRLPLFGDDGEVRAVLGIYDAPHTRDRETRLRSQLEEAVRGGGWEWDTVTGRVYWTAGMYRLHGLEPDSFVPTPGDLWRSFPAESQGRIEEMLTSLMSEGRSRTIEVPERIGPARPRILRLSVHPLLEGDRVIRIYGSMVDVTEANELKTLLDNLAEAFEIRERDILLRAVSHHLADALGASELIIALSSGAEGEDERLETLVRIVAGRLVEPVSYRVAGTPCETVLREGSCHVVGDLEDLYPDDPLLAGIDARAYVGKAVRDRAGRVRGVFSAFLRDPPAHPGVVDSLLRLAASRIEVELDRDAAHGALRSRAMAHLESQRVESLGRLAREIAREFNDVFTIISGNARLLGEVEGRTGETAEIVREVEQASREGGALAHRLLEFGRERPARTEPVELGGTVLQAESLLRALLGREVRLTLDAAGGERWVLADRAHLERLLVGLTMNAVDAMPSGGSLRIGVKADEIRRNAGHGIPSSVPAGRYAVLEFEDSGQGLPEPLRDRVLDPFHAEVEGRPALPGLTAIQGLVDALSGHLTVRGEAQRGTFVRVYLPLLEGSRLARAGATEVDALAGGAGREILVVEDDPALRSFVRSVLEQEGYAVLEAKDGFAAEELLRNSESRPRLLLTDVVMPGRSGQATALAVRQHRPEIGVLFMSGFEHDVLADDEVERLQADLLLKPFSSSALIDRVRAKLSSTNESP